MWSEGTRLAAIVAEIPRSATEVLRRLSAEALLFCGGHSAGVTLSSGLGRLAVQRRVAAVGPWARYTTTVVPHVSPEMLVFERKQSKLFVDPWRSFGYLADAEPAATQLLVSPLHQNDLAVGTAWVALHDDSRRFDAEDERRLTVLAECGSAAYAVACANLSTYDRDDSVSAPSRRHAALGYRTLSKRERQVSVMVARGHTNKDIAEALGINVKSVETYRARVSDKLGFRNRADFVTHAVTEGWFN